MIIQKYKQNDISVLADQFWYSHYISLRKSKRFYFLGTEISTVDTDDQPYKMSLVGLRRISRTVETRKTFSGDDGNIEQPTVSNEIVTAKERFFVDDALKEMFRNELHAYRIVPGRSDASVVRLVLQMKIRTGKDPKNVHVTTSSMKKYDILLKGPPGSKIYFFSRALNLTEIFTEYVSDL